MNDLINRQTAIAYSISGMTREIDGDKWIRVSEVRENIKMMPSAQPAPIKHGRWIVETDCEGKTRRCICNQCGFETGKYTWENPAYCEGCGAIMDGEEDANG